MSQQPDVPMQVLDVRTSWQLLRTRTLGRLAVTLNDHPEIFPVNFVIDRDTIVFRTAEGTKLSCVQWGANVAFEVDGLDGDRAEAWSVVVKGRAAEIRGKAERLDAAGLRLTPWHAARKPRVVRIEPLEITGRRFAVDVAAAGDDVDPERM